MQRVCVIGLGPIGNRHARLLQADELADLVGVCDWLPERADAAAELYGVPAFYSVDEMLAALDPDICHVATGGYEYGSEHYLPTMQALERGLPCAGRKAHLQHHQRGRGDGGQGRGDGRLLRHQPQPPLHAGGARWPNAGRTRVGWAICSSST